MAAGTSALGGLAGRYAAALYELADEAKALDAVADDLRALNAARGQIRELDQMIKSPLFASGAKTKAITAIAQQAKAHDLTRRFLASVARNGRLSEIRAITDAFLDELARQRGEVTAQVVSAKPLAASQIESLKASLAKAAGGKVTVEAKVDPSLLGGLTVRLGSRMVDTSLKSKLARLQLAMKEA